ncbi:ADAM17 [Lepeophtheirus salmonis]|uniref:ADAM17 n=1 Tax=Lepeophtheirus salmonis TaxID=72036 RepID=A0A7R8CS22_LEPSM|nr:ADAM17 [Lepeophtheirus salmonis]CAF2875583.1 ADAM17 [Lepeophtheirus salmonis]
MSKEQGTRTSILEYPILEISQKAVSKSSNSCDSGKGLQIILYNITINACVFNSKFEEALDERKRSDFLVTLVENFTINNLKLGDQKDLHLLYGKIHDISQKINEVNGRQKKLFEGSWLNGFFYNSNFYGNIYLSNGRIIFVSPEEITSGFNHRRYVSWNSYFLQKYNKDFEKFEKVCNIAVIVDASFLKNLKYVDLVILNIMWMITEVNQIIRISLPFLKIRISTFTIIKDSFGSPFLYPNNTIDEVDPDELLRRFSLYDLSDYCLGILFSARTFKKNQIMGFSWKGKGSPTGMGGICQKRLKYSKDGVGYSFNTLFITTRRREDPKCLNLRMTILNLGHEILHSFGAEHDTPGCSPEDEEINGSYLMSPYTSTGKSSNNELLSSCSISAVRKIH